MTVDNATRNLATFAQMRLDLLAEDHRIIPLMHMDLFLCEHCRFILRRVNGGWRHSEAEIRAMRSIASEQAWPTHNYRRGDGTPAEDSPVERASVREDVPVPSSSDGQLAPY